MTQEKPAHQGFQSPSEDQEVCGLETGTDGELLERWLETLIKRPFAELAALEDTQTVVAEVEGTRLQALLSKDSLPDGRLQLVVQSCTAGFCCMANLAARGLLLAPDGTVSPVPVEQMAEFSLT